ARSLGVVGTLATPIWPLASSTSATSVKVPPISTPIRQAMPRSPSGGGFIVDWMLGDGQSVSVAGGTSGPSQNAVAILTPRVLPRQTGHSYPVAAGGQGITIRDAAGKDYIDASSGAAVSCVGHSHPDVLAAMREQLDRLAYAHTSFFTTQVAEALADDLVGH